MSYTIKDNTRSIERRVDQAASLFLRFYAEDVVREARPNTPKDTGRMRDDVIKQVLGLRGKIRWTKKYAKYQEVKQFANYTTPGTGPHFAENAIKRVARKTDQIARRVGFK